MASDDKLKRTIKIENMEMRQSPPKAIVDCSPLQPAISKNKEGNFDHFRLNSCTLLFFIISTTTKQLVRKRKLCIILFFFLALKIKLMVRRPIAQLVDQGIIPCKYSNKHLRNFILHLTKH